MSNQALFDEWVKSDKQQKHWSSIEKGLRLRVIKAYYNYNENELVEKSVTSHTENNNKMVAQFKVNRTVNNEDDAVIRAINKAMLLKGGAAAIDGLIEWTPKFSWKVYKKLPPEIKAIFDELITEKSGTPSLSYSTEKKK